MPSLGLGPASLPAEIMQDIEMADTEAVHEYTTVQPFNPPETVKVAVSPGKVAVSPGKTSAARSESRVLHCLTMANFHQGKVGAYTPPGSKDEKSQGLEGIEILKGRPEMKQVISEGLHDTPAHMTTVLVCGPGKLVTSTEEAAHALGCRYSAEVFWR